MAKYVLTLPERYVVFDNPAQLAIALEFFNVCTFVEWRYGKTPEHQLASKQLVEVRLVEEINPLTREQEKATCEEED